MPPRLAKKTPLGPGSKRAARGRLANVQTQVEPEEDKLKSHEIDINQEIRIVEGNKQPIDMEHKEKGSTEVKAAAYGNTSAKKDEDARESIEEYEKDERLDFEDIEPEDYVGVDYDEKEIDQYPQEEGGEMEEDPEEIDDGEVGDVVEEDIALIHDELDPEEDDEHAGKVHGGTSCAAEEEEHHEVVKERRKRKEFEIFVGGLDKDATEVDLRKVFGEVGELTEVRLMMNPQTKKNKGFAFLRFATVEQAKQACVKLKNPMVNGKQCGVTPSQDNDTLFLGNICRSWSKEALKDKLKHYGVDNIEDLTLVEDSNSLGMNRGFAFLEFSSRSEAMDAFKRLQRRGVGFGVDRPAKVSFADSFIDPGDEIMAQVKTVFIDGLSASWDEEYVKDLIKRYGEIEKIELARNMPSARRKDFGFVTFDSHDAAVTCAKCINNEELGEGKNKAKVRARLSRPLERGKGKHVARGDFRPTRGSTHGGRSQWSRSVPRSVTARGPRSTALPHLPPVVDRGFKRPFPVRERRPAMVVPSRARPVSSLARSYIRRPPVPAYPKRDYDDREELHSRSRAPVEYSSRPTSDSRLPYREGYASHTSGYTDMPRGGASKSTARRAYVDDGYSQRYERPPPSYQDSRGREYDSISGSKRSYAAVDDAPRYSEAGMRYSRARLDYDIDTSSSHYSDAYSDRLGRSNPGYGGSRSSLSSQDSHGLYSSRQGMDYSGGLYGGSDVGRTRMYSSSFNDDYVSRGSDVGGSSYSSMYSGRGLGSNSYMGSSGSGSYY